MSGRLSLLALASLAGLAACQATPQEAARPDRPVLVQTVAFEPRAAERTFVATIRPRIESDLGFRIAGKVARRLVNVGERVRAGAILAALDPVDLRLQQEQAEAETRAAAAAQCRPRRSSAAATRCATAGRPPPRSSGSRRATDEARGRLARAERAVSWRRTRLTMRSSRRCRRRRHGALRSSPARSSPRARRRSASPGWKRPKPWSRCPRRRSGGPQGQREGQPLVEPDRHLCRPAARIVALCGSDDADLSGPFLHAGRGRGRRTRHDGHGAVGAAGERQGRPGAALGRLRPRHGPALWVVDVDARPALGPSGSRPTRRRTCWCSAASTKATRSSRSACRSSIPARRSGSCKRSPSERRRTRPDEALQLSAWAVHHPALVLFLILLGGRPATLSYQRLGRAEDPNFTIKLVVVTAIWPGATAQEMQDQVADRSRRSCRSCPIFDKVTTYRNPASRRCRSLQGQHAGRGRCRSSSTSCARSSYDIRPILPPA